MKYLLSFSIIFLIQFKLMAQLNTSDAKKWQKNLKQMSETLAKKHVSLYHTISKEKFDAAVNKLYNEIPKLSENEILVRIAQIVALVGDGHTSFFPCNQKNMWFGFYPIKLWQFKDGMYVTAADEKYKHLLGKKLIKIEDTELDQVVKKVSSTIGVDNHMEHVYSVSFLIPRAELLHVLGITKEARKATFHFEGGYNVLFKASELKEYRNLNWLCANSFYKDGKSPSQRLDFLFATKLTFENLKKRYYYWYEYLEEHNSIFFQYNTCWDQKKRPSFKDTVKEMFHTFDSLNAKKIIIDLRQNSGGEPATARFLIEELGRRPQLLKQKRVFVLIGRRTFSAALTNACQLRKLGAITVGEPSRGKPNNPSEGRDINLKYKKIWLTVSTQVVTRDPELGNAQYIPIDIPVDHFFTDFYNAIDKDFEAAIKAGILD